MTKDEARKRVLRAVVKIVDTAEEQMWIHQGDDGAVLSDADQLRMFEALDNFLEELTRRSGSPGGYVRTRRKLMPRD